MTTIDEAKKQILESNYFADKETVSELFDEHQSLKMDGAFFVNGNLKLTPFRDNRQSKFDPLDDIKSVN